MDMTRKAGWLIWPYPYTAVTVRFVLLSAAVHTVHYIERNLCVFLSELLCWWTVCLWFCETTCGGECGT